jgi:hypothetical protein
MSNFHSRTQQASWYGQLFGVEESSNYASVQANFQINSDATMTSLANGQTFQVGNFSTPTLSSLRSHGIALLRAYHAEQAKDSAAITELKYQHVVQGDVLLEHAQHPGAVLQAASQFNCLEFPSWQCLPEQGVTAYAHDHTQGPACALACAAGTVYRNYFADVDFHALDNAAGSAVGAGPTATPAATVPVLGQSKHRQINNLDLLQRALNNDAEKYFNVLNGYVFAQHERDLARLSAVIAASKQLPPPGATGELSVDGTTATTSTTSTTSTAPPQMLDYESLKGLVKIGLQRDVGVDFASRFRRAPSGVTVTQAYCSALSCAYSGMQNTHWAPLARLVLEANYEATLWAAVIHHLEGRAADKATVSDTTLAAGPSRQCSNQVFLTFLGGGVFGNEPEWIGGAIGRALAVLAAHKAPIEVNIGHYRNVNRQYVQLIDAAFQRERGIAR